MAVIPIVLKMVQNKWFWITLVLIAIGGYITFLNVRISSANNKIETLQGNIERLEATNLLLYKDLQFQSNKVIIQSNFITSDIAIGKINSVKLDKESKEAIDIIIKDYQKLFLEDFK